MGVQKKIKWGENKGKNDNSSICGDTILWYEEIEWKWNLIPFLSHSYFWIRFIRIGIKSKVILRKQTPTSK